MAIKLSYYLGLETRHALDQNRQAPGEKSSAQIHGWATLVGK